MKRCPSPSKARRERPRAGNVGKLAVRVNVEDIAAHQAEPIADVLQRDATVAKYNLRQLRSLRAKEFFYGTASGGNQNQYERVLSFANRMCRCCLMLPSTKQRANIAKVGGENHARYETTKPATLQARRCPARPLRHNPNRYP
jgi:hypothetical protein